MAVCSPFCFHKGANRRSSFVVLKREFCKLGRGVGCHPKNMYWYFIEGILADLFHPLNFLINESLNTTEHRSTQISYLSYLGRYHLATSLGQEPASNGPAPSPSSVCMSKRGPVAGRLVSRLYSTHRPDPVLMARSGVGIRGNFDGTRNL